MLILRKLDDIAYDIPLDEVASLDQAIDGTK